MTFVLIFWALLSLSIIINALSFRTLRKARRVYRDEAQQATEVVPIEMLLRIREGDDDSQELQVRALARTPFIGFQQLDGSPVVLHSSRDYGFEFDPKVLLSLAMHRLLSALRSPAHSSTPASRSCRTRASTMSPPATDSGVAFGRPISMIWN